MMKKFLSSAALAAAALAAPAETLLNGAGASFPAPVYQAWNYAYTQSQPDVKVNYQSLGSGAGVNQIKAGTVDFAGTDSPLTADELEAAGLEQFPMLTGGVVVIVNLPGIEADALKLDQATLAGIFLGDITRWDAPEIKALNPELRLPRLKISVVRRADASGTSFIFTDYLSKVSPKWAETVGSGTSVNWPVGIGGQKNPGVCNNVAKIRGSIGYTEYTYAVEAGLATVALANHQGVFVNPSPESFTAASANADWDNAPGFYMMLTDQPGEDSWPITGVTYLLIRKDCPADKRRQLIDYCNWCFTTGSTQARRLNYVPLPENVVSLIQDKVFQ